MRAFFRPAPCSGRGACLRGISRRAAPHFAGGLSAAPCPGVHVDCNPRCAFGFVLESAAAAAQGDQLKKALRRAAGLHRKLQHALFAGFPSRRLRHCRRGCPGRRPGPFPCRRRRPGSRAGVMAKSSASGFLLALPSSKLCRSRCRVCRESCAAAAFIFLKRAGAVLTSGEVIVRRKGTGWGDFPVKG